MYNTLKIIPDTRGKLFLVKTCVVVVASLFLIPVVAVLFLSAVIDLFFKSSGKNPGYR